jgi:hypothetical protein
VSGSRAAGRPPRRPCACAAARPSCGEAVEGALSDEFTFHLSRHGGDHEQHLVGDRGARGAVLAGADAGEDVQVDLTGV